MERNKKAGVRTSTLPVESLHTWKKVGGGSLWIRKHIVKPGEIFKANIEDIPEAFRDVIIPWNGEGEGEVVMDTTPTNLVPTMYSLEELENGKFNVVNSAGKAINEKLLTKKVADQLVEDLNG